MISITIKKANLSTNKIYAMHHMTRMKESQALKDNMTIIMDTFVLGAFDVSVEANNRLDLDNNSGMIKIAIDYMRKLGYITNDDQKYFKKLIIIRNPYIGKNTLKIEITPHVKL